MGVLQSKDSKEKKKIGDYKITFQTEFLDEKLTRKNRKKEKENSVRESAKKEEEERKNDNNENNNKNNNENNKDENKLKYYDEKIKINTLKEFLVKGGSWKVLKNEGCEEKEETERTIIGVVGDMKKGKTHLMEKIMNEEVVDMKENV